MTNGQTHRTYGGKTREQRQDERRVALVRAGRELWADGGLPAVTVRGVCARTRLTDRYFYEQFSAIGDLVLQIVDDVFTELFAAMTAAGRVAGDQPHVQLTAGLTAYLEHSIADPAVLRILTSDLAGFPGLAAKRRSLQNRVARGILLTIAPEVAQPEPALLEAAVFGVGGVTLLMEDWLADENRCSAAQLGARATDMCMRLLGPLA
ncbi:TetR/AcrR family transcriptional regulator [Mycobacteroides chelonae]|uniref:TetR/AcrR family transcriptional regulator n=1 Tax=Mycobacteroides chelonae TaxID=1774 RepID=UPI0019106CAC|nr:TetR family transcriptional regulator [Mycobacteroides chelonae]QQG98846.1 TetR/AcrR family transcriptional regulator [Mycobacteroides chelonae]